MILERGRRVYDYNGASNSGFVVSQKFKDIVEEFDKDEHQFFQVEILNGDHSPYAGGNYYLMHVRQPLDTIITDGSDLQQVMPLSKEPEHKKNLHVGAYSHFTVSAERVNGAGLWLEVRAGTHYFASEALLQRFKEEDVQG